MHKFALIFVLLSSTAIPVGAYAQQNAPASAVHEVPPDSEMVYRTNLGRADDIKLLIQKGGSVDAKDNNGIGLLFLAAGRKDAEAVPLVELYLAQGLDLNDRDPEGRTPLFYAAKSGNTATVQFLLDKGVDSYALDNQSETARTAAYKAGHKEVVDVMDNFVRKKSQEVTEAYEQVNKELENRYKKLEEEHNKTTQLALEAEKQKAALELEAQQQKAILALETEKQRLETAKLKLEAAKQSLGNNSGSDTDSTASIPVPIPSTADSPTATPPTSTTALPPAAPASNGDESLEGLAKQTAEIQAQIDQTKATQLKSSEEYEKAIKLAEEEKKKAEEKRLVDTEKAIAEKINEANLKQTLKEQLHREALEAKRAEEELAAKMAAELSEEEAKLKAAADAEIEEAKKHQQTKEKEQSEKAAKALEEEFFDIEMERNLRAQLAAEMEWSEYEKSMTAPEKLKEPKAEDPATIKAKKELEEKLQQQKSELFSDLIFHNCSFQYWYFCYTTKQSTELEPEDLTKAIRVNKDKIETTQERLLGEFQVDANIIKDISETAKKIIYKQLDDIPSKRLRHEKGVGQISDVRKRCDEVVNNWDLFSSTTPPKKPNRGKTVNDTEPAPEEFPEQPVQENTPSPENTLYPQNTVQPGNTLYPDSTPGMMIQPKAPSPKFQAPAPVQQKAAPNKKSQSTIPSSKSSANYGLNIPASKSSANYGMQKNSSSQSKTSKKQKNQY
jgi:hypothetical protein